MVAMPDNEPRWVDEMAERERSRRATSSIMREALLKFAANLRQCIHEDMEAYNKHFPAERHHIEVKEDSEGFTAIIRARSDTSRFDPPIKAKYRFVPAKGLMECRFTADAHKALSRDFVLTVEPDGSIAIPDGMSVVDMSRYLLAPMLFPKLVADEGETAETPQA